MDLVRSPVEFGKLCNFYKHSKNINSEEVAHRLGMYRNANPNYYLKSDLFACHSRPCQTPNNFLGIKSIRPPMDDSRIYKQKDLWTREQYGIPLAKNFLVPKYYNVNC